MAEQARIFVSSIADYTPLGAEPGTHDVWISVRCNDAGRESVRKAFGRSVFLLPRPQQYGEGAKAGQPFTLTVDQLRAWHADDQGERAEP